MQRIAQIGACLGVARIRPKAKGHLLARLRRDAVQDQIGQQRLQPFGAAGTTYDVFNTQGERTYRVVLSTSARVVGFGSAAVYAVVRSGGRVVLEKYTL